MAACLATLLAALPAGLLANSSTATITAMRAGLHASHARLVIDLTKPAAYELTMGNGGRSLELTLRQAVPSSKIRTTGWTDNPYVRSVMVTRPTPDTTLATVLLAHPVRPNLFTLQNPHRVVLDLYKVTAEEPKPVAAHPPRAAPRRATLIVIDPGHGGKDPGAIGRSGLQEKAVVLDIGHRLKKLLAAEGHRIIMTRDDDTFIPLEERTALANKAQADLYISIHANASPVRSVKGVEIYLLGKASDAAARETAARENGASDALISDLDLIFRDMEQDYRVNHSISLAHLTRTAFMETVGRRYQTVDLGVKRAPFYVLMKSSMPGILAEVSFISNPGEESRLKQAAYRQKVAEALFDGIRRHLRTTDIQS